MNQNNQTVIIIGVGGIAAVFGLYKIIDFFSKENRDDRQMYNEAEKEIVKSELTFDENQYRIYAGQLLTAMEGVGTDYYTIERIIFSMKNKSDWKKLFVEFGTKEVHTTFYDFSGNLNDWLNDELDNFEKDNIIQYLMQIGVNF